MYNVQCTMFHHPPQRVAAGVVADLSFCCFLACRVSALCLLGLGDAVSSFRAQCPTMGIKPGPAASCSDRCTQRRHRKSTFLCPSLPPLRLPDLREAVFVLWSRAFLCYAVLLWPWGQHFWGIAVLSPASYIPAPGSASLPMQDGLAETSLFVSMTDISAPQP